jgi:hypothetical protein
MDIEYEVEDIESELELVDQTLLEIEQNRYYSKSLSKFTIQKSVHFRNIFLNFDDLSFKHIVRLTKKTFDLLLKEIQDHPVFQNNSHCPQKPV